MWNVKIDKATATNTYLSKDIYVYRLFYFKFSFNAKH